MSFLFRYSWVLLRISFSKAFFDKITEGFKKLFGEEAFKVADLAKFTPEELLEYEESLRIYRDNINVIETAREEGAKGRAI
jgi:hypothetical protein